MVGIFVSALVWVTGCAVAAVVNTESREDYYGGTTPARGRDLACILLSWFYLAGLLVRAGWLVAKAAVEAVRRGW